MTGTCKHCGCQIHLEGDGWVDNSGGDVCGHDGANAPHEDILDAASGPYSILWLLEGNLFKAGPFKDEPEAMAWANENRYRSEEHGSDFEFDLDDEHVYLFGPDHSMTELENGDFESDSESNVP